ncbi:MAG TPA: hypothetical protein VM388_07085 [Acidimicrobiales bacterium]|nr:hypothetical protein [Acidimicrobiales bacterium]
MMGDELGDDLGQVSRAMRAEYRDAREIEEEATEQLARKEADLVDLVLEAMQRGRPLRVRVGASQFEGTVVHVGEDVVIIEDGRGAQVDVRLDALDELWIQPSVPGTGRGRRSNVPATFADCLEGLEATGREVELGGPRLPPLRGRVIVAARDHVVLEGRPGDRVIPRAAVGFVIRRR